MKNQFKITFTLSIYNTKKNAKVIKQFISASAPMIFKFLQLYVFHLGLKIIKMIATRSLF